MALPSAGATAGIAATAYSVGAIIAQNLVWYESLQTPAVVVPSTISDGWTILFGAGLQAIGHGLHWYANRRNATTAVIVATPKA
jgi:hypothetical protein